MVQKSFLLKTLVLSLFMFLLHAAATGQAVEKYTAYDSLPDAQPILKPDYEDDMPDWAKMLYQFPVNYNDVTQAYKKWEDQEKIRLGLSKVRNPLIRYYRFWVRAVEPYTLFDGTIEMPDLDKIQQQLKKTQANSYAGPMRAPAAGNNSDWSFVGPKKTVWDDNVEVEAPWQVNVYSIDISRTNPDIVYIGTETGYVNKSVDKGVSWEQSGRDYVFGGAVTAVGVSPLDPDSAFACAGRTVHRTTDGGATWHRTSASFSTNRMKVDHATPGTYFVAASDGVRYTRDGGDTWRRSSGISTTAWDVAIKPTSSDTIYALTHANNTNQFRVLMSSNAGVNFTPLNFPDTLYHGSGGLLAVTPAEPNALYVFMLTSNMNKRPFLYKGEIDSNQQWTWTKQHTGSDASFTSNALTNGQGYFDIVLAVSPINKSQVFAGTTTLFRSMNSGRTFSAIGGYQGNYSIHPDIQEIKFLPDGDLWVTTDGGVNFTSDGFTNRRNYRPSTDGMVGSDFWGFDQGWNEDIMVGGRYHNGNTVITDFYGYDHALRMGGAESPTGWVLQGKSRHVAFDDLGNGYILPKALGGEMEGRFIFSKHPNMDMYGANRSNIATHPHYSGTLYLGSENSIWVSTNFGVTYDLLYTFPGRVRYLNVAMSDPNVMYADIVGQGLYRTSDGGKTWQRKVQPISWGGFVAFVISPYNADYVYATMQTGSNNGEVYRTKNGGNSWEKWSNFSATTKSLAIQPTKDGKDLVYLFITSNGGNPASVYYRKDGDADWTEFDTGYPRGFRVNIALPFYRDSKLRVSGNGGVWETPLAEPDFEPIIIPWVEQRVYPCSDDVIQLDSHSILNQEGVTWEWEVTPAPRRMSSTKTRNPKVWADPGVYSVTLTVTKDGKTYTSSVQDMFEVRECPSIYTCDNPGELPQKEWRLVGTNSHQPGEDGTKAFDGNINTIWHTEWSPNEPTHPHHIAIDFSKEYLVSTMIYYPRSTGSSNGRIKDYELYVSNDKDDWGQPVSAGTFENTEAPQYISIPPTTARYAKLVALSEMNDNPWASVAELKFVGCLEEASSTNDLLVHEELRAFPVPAGSVVNIELPFQDGLNFYSYHVYNAQGAVIQEGIADESMTQLSINLGQYQPGNYFVRIQDKRGVIYRVKFIKN